MALVLVPEGEFRNWMRQNSSLNSSHTDSLRGNGWEYYHYRFTHPQTPGGACYAKVSVRKGRVYKVHIHLLQAYPPHRGLGVGMVQSLIGEAVRYNGGLPITIRGNSVLDKQTLDFWSGRGAVGRDREDSDDDLWTFKILLNAWGGARQ